MRPGAVGIAEVTSQKEKLILLALDENFISEAGIEQVRVSSRYSELQCGRSQGSLYNMGDCRMLSQCQLMNKLVLVPHFCSDISD